MAGGVTATRRIGLLGGTFNPPHVGHLELATRATEQLQLDEVRFLPVGDPTHKPVAGRISVNHRVAMTALALAGRPRFMLDLSDILRPEPHYTSTLVGLFRAQFPQAALWLLIGGDSLRDFYKWYRPAHIVGLVRLGVLPRPDVTVDWEPLDPIPNLRQRVDMLEGGLVDVSSTMLRAIGADDERRRAYLPPLVSDYIGDHKLYGADDA